MDTYLYTFRLILISFQICMYLLTSTSFKNYENIEFVRVQQEIFVQNRIQKKFGCQNNNPLSKSNNSHIFLQNRQIY